MKKTKNVLREFVNANINPIKNTSFGDIKPIEPKTRKVIIPQDRWLQNQEAKTLEKTFMFKSIEKRNIFLERLLVYEKNKKHNARILIDEFIVKIKLHTKNIKDVTELDREYANYVDSVYRDVLTEWRKNDKFEFIPC